MTAHASWCPQVHALCECEFWQRRRQWVWRLVYAINRKRGCEHPRPLGRYGSNDSWCSRCGRVIGGPPRAGEIGW